jgi:hypothetical protein
MGSAAIDIICRRRQLAPASYSLNTCWRVASCTQLYHTASDLQP